MSDETRYPSDLSERFQVRMPPGLRDRIRVAADKHNRSMNAEILNTLQGAYPEPITIEEVTEDINETLRILKRFKGNTLLLVLADQLDELIYKLSKSEEGNSDDRQEAKEYVENQAKFMRFSPPDRERDE